ncbi:hypothetical protein NP493_6345g00001 [Ridgeia piscesae]|uniref:Uncharacterized protein n=1 Tax=Ridgeia piscesae TaxID=27915 RepID=A0AAD9IQZ9_RIDPI|nr:hypothetical protein NP493_7170g00011 [Ridgeia piscesae]KAK2139552.1 hypothetical protein NP493_6345g00001 [Ridgeia piscesae]
MLTPKPDVTRHKDVDASPMFTNQSGVSRDPGIARIKRTASLWNSGVNVSLCILRTTERPESTKRCQKAPRLCHKSSHFTIICWLTQSVTNAQTLYLETTTRNRTG